MDVNEVFRLRLNAEMRAKGLNPSSLSTLAGMNRRAVTDIMDGKSVSPKLSTAYQLAQAVGCTLDELTGHAPQVTIAPKLLELLEQYDEAEQEQLAAAILALPRGPASAR